MKNNFTTNFFILVLFLYSSSLFAQSGVGKLSGKIIDANTREPLIGANVVIVNSELGAATNIDGEYFILNITPGTYNVKISYVGYAPRTVQGVRIVAGITYELNVELSTDFTLPEIVVEDKKFFEEKATNTVKVVDANQISKLPVEGIANIVSIQAGVVVADGSGGQDGNAAINVRGGRSGEVLYIIDGVPQNNVLSNSSSAQVSNDAIEQISFQVGGYEAKYGQAQSGIVNVTTKSGTPDYSIFADAATSSLTDEFGYNQYTLNFSGPIIPGNTKHTIFLSAERSWFLDATPPAVNLEFPSINKTYTHLPNNDAGVWRFTGRTHHFFGKFKLSLGGNINLRNGRSFILSYAKNNSEFNPAFNQKNYSFSTKISQTISNNTFWNLNIGFRRYSFKQYEPHFGDDLYLYGDSVALAQLGATIAYNGQRVQVDQNQIFYGFGRVSDFYSKNENDALDADFDLASQIDNHLIEIGGGVNYNIVRYYAISPVQLAAADPSLSETKKFENLQPSLFGYDITGKTKTGLNDKFAPKNPLFAYAYIQDRYELEDLVLNLGLRMDYFDSQADILIDPSHPFAGGTNPGDFDPGDFTKKKPELQFSPRIGLGFPVTQSTVFHAQYGRFIQIPALTDLYASQFDLDQFISFNPQYIQTGTIHSEETIQYEIGFRQILGSVAALNITTFYKNIKGLVNRQTHYFQRSYGGEVLTYISPTNSDFGTTRGLALSLDVTRLSYFSLSFQYTYSIAEGTGSSTSSSQTAAFRNQDNAAPKVIAPLDFDQRHTGVVNLDFYVPKDELGIFEMTSASVLVSFNSGRPYTPLNYYDILSGNNGGPSTIGYINSRYMPGTFRVDLKIEKSFSVSGILISPYLWIQNLFDADNVVNVWRSTGDPYTTGFLNTDLGKDAVALNGEGYKQDYTSLERDPSNFGIPRLIRLGMKINFKNIGL